ncbi:dihydrodipicolinate synthase family protein [Roseimaritima ulvae]|uniref:5-dehydro-4-deoxyglucarate dehydratase n=1 Tax=Roseimaritima ulvae TaxID=980254 RepID=A0A5B9QYZ5_9BACT|nr:dihydrodipicolinate synthase family protein [Roseimaritima ulvae]QEG42386.1 5-dehydro-4-deoxyglucarate dehydratase [Roseimaritima ulvae]
MDTTPQTPERLATSVFAVPPLARDAQLKPCATQNKRLIGHLEAGGVNLLLYGGNAVFYHIRMNEYASILEMLSQSVQPTTAVVPSIGPAFGTMMDQVEVLKDFDFPTVMVLPARDIADADGIARGIRMAAEALQKPLVVYLKFDRWLPPSVVGSLVEDGLVSWIKYAVVRDNPAEDDYLREILDVVPGNRIVSGIGEQPAIIHMRDFGVGSFTSGCVCVAPRLSMQMLKAIQNKDYDAAEAIRKQFEPLEDQRNAINPIRVLHRAVDLAGISDTGPMLPLLGELSESQEAELKPIAEALLQQN